VKDLSHTHRLLLNTVDEAFFVIKRVFAKGLYFLQISKKEKNIVGKYL